MAKSTNQLLSYSAATCIYHIGLVQSRGAKADPGGVGNWGDRPPKTYKSNFFPHDFVQFGKQHSRYRAILPSIVLSEQCCEVLYTSSLLQ